jgi:hypothetical protein
VEYQLLTTIFAHLVAKWVAPLKKNINWEDEKNLKRKGD